jgi:hypothetical protein
VRDLSKARDVPPGKYEVEWDGTLRPGEAARFELPYIIQVQHDRETEFFNVVAKKGQ